MDRQLYAFCSGFSGRELDEAIAKFRCHRESSAGYHTTGDHTSVVYAIDLSLLVPSLVLGAILLWQRLPWGYALAAILMIKCTAYPLALIAMSVFADKAGVPGAWDMAPFWMSFAVGSLIASGFLFGNMQSADGKELKLPHRPAQ